MNNWKQRYSGIAEDAESYLKKPKCINCGGDGTYTFYPNMLKSHPDYFEPVTKHDKLIEHGGVHLCDPAKGGCFGLNTTHHKCANCVSSHLLGEPHPHMSLLESLDLINLDAMEGLTIQGRTGLPSSNPKHSLAIINGHVVCNPMLGGCAARGFRPENMRPQ